MAHALIGSINNNKLLTDYGHIMDRGVSGITINNTNILHFPIFSHADFVFFRLFGPGLGNLLFPLYRAFQSQQMIGGKLVFPQFFQIKPGPFLRMEKDKRTYFDLFKRRSLHDVALHFRAQFLSSIPEELVNQAGLQLDRVKLIKYEGLQGYFKNLELRHLADFKNYLLKAANHEQVLREDIARITKEDICVHVRRGDFATDTTQGAASGGMCYQISDDWYVEAVSRARKQFPHGRIRVFTDDSILQPDLLAKLKCDELDRSRNALHALMKMSAHGAIVASKSSFSLWSAFLGQQYLYINNTFELERYMPSEQLWHERV